MCLSVCIDNNLRNLTYDIHTMKILVINCGSSSIKYKLYEMDDKSVLAAGGIEKIGLEGSFLKTKINGETKIIESACPTHTEGIKLMFDTLLNPEYGAIKHLLLPYSYLCLLLFTVGVGFILSTISVFLRDMFYIYGIVLTILTYFTPIMYDINMLDPWIQQVLKFNPLYHYITFARTIILYDQMPSVKSFIICGASCLITLVIGMIVFKKNQDKFIYYM